MNGILSAIRTKKTNKVQEALDKIYTDVKVWKEAVNEDDVEMCTFLLKNNFKICLEVLFYTVEYKFLKCFKLFVSSCHDMIDCNSYIKYNQYGIYTLPQFVACYGTFNQLVVVCKHFDEQIKTIPFIQAAKAINDPTFKKLKYLVMNYNLSDEVKQQLSLLQNSDQILPLIE